MGRGGGGGGGGWVGKGGRAKCSARGLVRSVSYAQVPDLDQHQLDDDVLLVCVLLPAFVSSADAGGERSGPTDRHAHRRQPPPCVPHKYPDNPPATTSPANTQTHILHLCARTHPVLWAHFCSVPRLQFGHLAKLVQSWLNCYYWPILAAIQFAQFVQKTRYWRDFIANLICKKHPDIADSPLESASSQLMEGPISM